MASKHASSFAHGSTTDVGVSVVGALVVMLSTVTAPSCFKVPLWICDTTLVAAPCGIVTSRTTLPALTSTVTSDSEMPAALARLVLTDASLAEPGANSSTVPATVRRKAVNPTLVVGATVFGASGAGVSPGDAVLKTVDGSDVAAGVEGAIEGTDVAGEVVFGASGAGVSVAIGSRLGSGVCSMYIQDGVGCSVGGRVGEACRRLGLVPSAAEHLPQLRLQNMRMYLQCMTPSTPLQRRKWRNTSYHRELGQRGAPR